MKAVTECGPTSKRPEKVIPTAVEPTEPPHRRHHEALLNIELWLNDIEQIAYGAELLGMQVPARTLQKAASRIEAELKNARRAFTDEFNNSTQKTHERTANMLDLLVHCNVTPKEEKA